MEITGRLTGDAEVKKTQNNKEFVAFTVAVNDYYKPKNGEAKEFTEYFNCSYWLTTKIADSLLKGCAVTVTGRVYLNQYEGKEGKQHAILACHVHSVKIIATAKKKDTEQKVTAEEPVPAGAPVPKDDLPF